MTWQDRSMVALLAALLAACGGSGSTGLISPENAVLGEVRRDGTCVTSGAMVTYCATGSPDAVSPAGASASGPAPVVPAPTPTSGGVPTSSPRPTSAGASPTAAASAGPTPQPTPCRGSGCAESVELQFVVHGLPAGAACALAARIARSDSAWSTGELVAAGGATRTITPALPADVGPGAVEVALLCFDARPQALPRSIAMLADADPDVVFVPAEPVTVPAG